MLPIFASGRWKTNALDEMFRKIVPDRCPSIIRTYVGRKSVCVCVPFGVVWTPVRDVYVFAPSVMCHTHVGARAQVSKRVLKVPSGVLAHMPRVCVCVCVCACVCLCVCLEECARECSPVICLEFKISLQWLHWSMIIDLLTAKQLWMYVQLPLKFPCPNEDRRWNFCV